MREYLRGGAKNQDQLDHRTMMLGWARDRLHRDAPEYAGPTIDMILKAENRVISALLNARSQAQVRDVISSAWKRANIQVPSMQRPKGTLVKANECAQMNTEQHES